MGPMSERANTLIAAGTSFHRRGFTNLLPRDHLLLLTVLWVQAAQGLCPFFNSRKPQSHLSEAGLTERVRVMWISKTSTGTVFQRSFSNRIATVPSQRFTVGTARPTSSPA